MSYALEINAGLRNGEKNGNVAVVSPRTKIPLSSSQSYFPLVNVLWKGISQCHWKGLLNQRIKAATISWWIMWLLGVSLNFWGRTRNLTSSKIDVSWTAFWALHFPADVCLHIKVVIMLKSLKRFMLDFLKVLFRIPFYFTRLPLALLGSGNVRNIGIQGHFSRNVRIPTEKQLCCSHISRFFLFQNTHFVIQIYQFFEVNNTVHCFNSERIFVWTKQRRWLCDLYLHKKHFCSVDMLNASLYSGTEHCKFETNR